MAMHLIARRCLTANIAGLHHPVFLDVFAFLPSTSTFPSPLPFHLYYDSANFWSAFTMFVFFKYWPEIRICWLCYILWFSIQSKILKASIWLLLSTSFSSLIYSLFHWFSWLTWLHSSNSDFTTLWLDKLYHNFVGYLGVLEVEL